MLNRIGRWIDAHPIHVMTWGYALALILTMAICLLIATPAHAQTAPSGALSASPASGVAPLNVNLAWSVSNTVGATPCTASGGWTGAKAATGSQAVTVTAATTFSLKCDGVTETASFTWSPPTQNEDGTTLTDLASYKIYDSRDGVNYGTPVTIPAPASTYSWPNLPAGLHYWKISSVSTSNGEGAATPSVQRTLLALSKSFSAGVTVTSPPKPPTGFTVTVSTLAYELRQFSNGTLRFVAVGTVPLGKECGIGLAGNYAQFTGATITKPVTGGVIAAKCAPPA